MNKIHTKTQIWALNSAKISASALNLATNAMSFKALHFGANDELRKG